MGDQERQETATSVSLTLSELARLQGASPVEDLGELEGDFWESDEELEAFLAELRASRNASLT